MRYNAVFSFLIIHLQMCVRMSKLEFFCNRPTIVALISFGLDISAGNEVTSDTDSLKTSPERPLVKERTDEKGRVRGLLGFGKERVVFHLNMNVDSVTIFLNKEDGSQLAKLVQESFLMDLKVNDLLSNRWSFSLPFSFFCGFFYAICFLSFLELLFSTICYSESIAIFYLLSYL